MPMHPTTSYRYFDAQDGFTLVGLSREILKAFNPSFLDRFKQWIRNKSFSSNLLMRK